MKRVRREAVTRLKSVLLQDKLHAPNNFIEFVKRDIYTTLFNYFEINEEDIELTVEVDKAGNYIIEITGRAYRLKNIPVII